MKKIVILLIQFYRLFISPLFPPRCRFQPTCSQYALTAIERFGLVTGGAMATKRILSCHPWHIGGYDPVPDVSNEERKTSKNSTSASSLKQ